MRSIVSAADISAEPELIWELMFGYPDYVEATDQIVEIPEQAFDVGYTYMGGGVMVHIAGLRRDSDTAGVDLGVESVPRC